MLIAEQEPIDVNNLALETLKILSGELNDHAVKTNLELASELPPSWATAFSCRKSS